jgi:hypothetical protein
MMLKVFEMNKFKLSKRKYFLDYNLCKNGATTINITTIVIMTLDILKNDGNPIKFGKRMVPTYFLFVSVFSTCLQK